MISTFTDFNAYINQIRDKYNIGFLQSGLVEVTSPLRRRIEPDGQWLDQFIKGTDISTTAQERIALKVGHIFGVDAEITHLIRTYQGERIGIQSMIKGSSSAYFVVSARELLTMPSSLDSEELERRLEVNGTHNYMGPKRVNESILRLTESFYEQHPELERIYTPMEKLRERINDFF